MKHTSEGRTTKLRLGIDLNPFSQRFYFSAERNEFPKVEKISRKRGCRF